MGFAKDTVHKAMFLFEVRYSYDSFKHYVELIDGNLGKESKKIETEYFETIDDISLNPNNYNADFVNEIHMSQTNRIFKIEKEFKYRFRESMILQLCSYLESELKKHCEIMAFNNHTEFSMALIKKFGNSDIQRLYKYYKVTYPKEKYNHKLWLFIDNLRKVRNRLVHHGSITRIGESDYNSISKFSKGNFILKSYQKDGTEFLIRFNDLGFILLCNKKIKEFIEDLVFN